MTMISLSVVLNSLTLSSPLRNFTCSEAVNYQCILSSRQNLTWLPSGNLFEQNPLLKNQPNPMATKSYGNKMTRSLPYLAKV